MLVAFGATAAAVCATSVARADTGPLHALERMLDESPTLTIVTTSVALVADGGVTTLDLMDALRGRSAERGFYAVQTAIAAPQAIGFALAPFYFDIDTWKPAENLLLLLPFQTLSSSLTTHGIWSIARPDFDPAARFGASFLVGLDTAFSTTALGCASREHWAPLEVAIAELSAGALELGLTFERALDDPDHSGEWAALAVWSSLLSTHGALSLALGEESEGDGYARRDPAPGAAPFVTPTAGGLTVGALGVF
jgi:hypothetical protein